MSKPVPKPDEPKKEEPKNEKMDAETESKPAEGSNPGAPSQEAKPEKM